MIYTITSGHQAPEQADTLREARKALTAVVRSWHRTPQHTAAKRRDPDSPIGYRYALFERKECVSYVTVDLTEYL